MFGPPNIQIARHRLLTDPRGRTDAPVLPTFVIGLREGLEASLIVGIIAAFLIQRGERSALRPMWLGVGAAVALCLAVAVVLRVIDESLPSAQRESFEAVLAFVAVGGITYMIVWMRRHSRALKGSLEHSADRALASGSAMALVAMAFLAVLREGLETAVFLLATFQNSTSPAVTGAGAVLGIGAAVALGIAIFRGGVRINLSRFFRATGFVLAIVAAGLLALGVHAAQEAGWTTALRAPAFDLTWLVAPGTVRASLLTGVLGLQPVPTVAEIVAWLLYAVPMGAYVLWPHRPRPASTVPVTSPAT
jgi:high-affinity iron transporter